MEKKFFIDWNNEIPQEEFINNILADEDLVKIRSLVISRWGECYEESCQPIIDMFAEHAERFAHLESLFIGDMESEECEISWIKQGDYSRLYAALPNLKKLTIKGTQDLELGEIAHDKLEHLEIISGGTPCNVFASLQNSQLPALKTLIVYIGVEDYGFDTSLDIVMKLASKIPLPKPDASWSGEQRRAKRNRPPRAGKRHSAATGSVGTLLRYAYRRRCRASSQTCRSP